MYAKCNTNEVQTISAGGVSVPVLVIMWNPIVSGFTNKEIKIIKRADILIAPTGVDATPLVNTLHVNCLD